jgi:hypothetical protein
MIYTIPSLNMPHVYLVQPMELVGTNRYKVGMSSLGNLSRVRSYKNGSRYLCIFEKPDAYMVERRLLRAFRAQYKLIAGNEYFEAENEAAMIDLFISVAMGGQAKEPQIKEPQAEESPSSSESEQAEEPPSTSWLKKYAYGFTGS